MNDLLRLVGGIVFLALAGLTAVTAPTQFLWKLSVAATEGGHWLAIGAMVTAIPWYGQGRLGKLGGLLSLGAVALFAFPLYQASQLGKGLPAKLDTSFGTEQRTRGRFAEDQRPEPLVMFDLVSSVQSRPVRLEERVFASADNEKLTLDIYRPGYNHEPLPGLIVVHGGSWQSGHSKEFIALNGYLAARDYVVVSINYRLAPKWKFPAGRDDVLSAIAYLKVYGKEFGLDANRLALLGRSAGGQLALLAAYTASEPAIRGVISAYGPTDLKFGYDRPAARGLLDTRGVLESYLGGPPAKADDAYFAASPINFVTPASPPTLLIHGLHDGHVSPEESARLEAKLTEANVKNLFVRLPWATHACDWSFSGPCGQITTYAIERFLERAMFTPAAATKPQSRLARLARK
jgi:acetyl esterase/lipase